MIRNLFFAIVFPVLFLMPGIILSEETAVSSKDYMKLSLDAESAYMENPEYAKKKQEIDIISKERDAIIDKIAEKNPEFKKDIAEFRILLNEFMTAKEPSPELQSKSARYFELSSKTENELVQSKEYAKNKFKSQTKSFEALMLANEIQRNSKDPRLMKLKSLAIPPMINMEKMPKAKVEGSPEFQTAVYIVEDAKSKSPMESKWPIAHAFVLLRGKAFPDALTHDETVNRLHYDHMRIMHAMTLRANQLNEENFDAAYEKLIAQTAMMNPAKMNDREAREKMMTASKKMNDILLADKEYQKLQKEALEANSAYDKAFDEFINKSELPSAVEYRKFIKIVNELQAEKK